MPKGAAGVFNNNCKLCNRKKPAVEEYYCRLCKPKITKSIKRLETAGKKDDY